MKNPKKMLCIALVLILIGSVFACLLQTDFGNVSVKDIYLPTENQNYLHALAFIPKSASEENKLPVVITTHGWLNSAEVQDAACIELSRRGIVVIALDNYNHGDSGCVDEMMIVDAVNTGGGIYAMVDYVTSGIMNYVDTERVGLMGHSMGANGSKEVAFYYSTLYDEAILEAQSADSDGGEEITEEEQAYCDSVMKIKALLPTGQVPNFLNYSGIDWKWSQLRCNAGIVYGTYEECGYANSTGNARVLGTAQETVEMIQSADPTVTSVEEGKFYGNKEDGTLRVIYQPLSTHPLIHFMPEATAAAINFWTYVFDVPTTISESNQVYFLKEIFNLVAMIGLFMLIIPMCALLLKVPCFASLSGSEGPKLPSFTGNRKKKYWLGAILGGIVSLGAAFLSVKVVPTADVSVNNGYLQTSVALFAVPTMNTIAFWTLICAAWQFIWFYICYKSDVQNGIDRESSLGLKISGKDFWKSVGLAATIIGFLYVVVWFCKWAFNTDFRFWTPAVKTFNVGKMIYFLPYLPAFFAFYLGNSMIVNSAGRFDGMSERKELWMHALTNIIGCFLFWAIQYIPLFLGGAIVVKGQWLNVLVIAFCIWQLFLAPFLLRKFYKLTGKHWVGAFTVSSFYVLIGIMNTAIHSTIL